MSTTEKTSAQAPSTVEPPLPLRDLAVILIKHYGIHEGLYDLSVEFQIGIGAVGPSPTALTPGAMIGVSRIGLIPSSIEGPTTVDAAVVNPLKKKTRKKSTA